MMRTLSPVMMASLLVGSTLACGNRPLDEDPKDESTTASETTAADSGPSSMSGMTTMVDSASTTGSASSTGPDVEDGNTTESPPLFDLGEIPDMPGDPKPPLEEFDCSTVTDMPMGYQIINGPRAYHGLAISSEGMMIGSDGNSLIESDYFGNWGVFIPGIGSGQQMDWLLDGDLAYSTSDSAITRVRLDGTTQVIRPGVGAYAVVLGPDGLIYSDSGSQIVRIDPMNGDLEYVIGGFSSTPHSIGFSPSNHRMYVGVIGSPTVYYVELDASFDPVGSLQILSSQVGSGNAWHDAIAVDACGYLYVPNYWERNLYRVAPNGDTIVYWDPANQSHYPHGLAWGTGEDGWVRDALYFPQPYNGNSVGELIIGVPPRDFGGVALNPPPE